MSVWILREQMGRFSSKVPQVFSSYKNLNQNCLCISHAVLWNIRNCLQGTPCWIGGERSGPGTHFLQVLRFFSVTMCPPMLYTHLSTITDAT